MPEVYVGIDGGGTKTTCLLLDQQGNPVGQKGQAGCSNQNSVGKENAKNAIQEAIMNALNSASLQLSDVRGICLGISGVDRPDDIITVKGWLKDIFGDQMRFDVERDAQIYNDAVIALASGTEGVLEGIVIISGTGMISLGFSKNESGELVRVRAGGWGPLLGDEGAGWSIAHNMLNAVARASDGRGPQTELVGAVLEKLGLSKPEDIIGWTYKDISWHRMAELAPVVFSVAASGDAVAKQIVEHATDELVLAAVTVAKKLGFHDTAFTCVLVGGSLTREDSMLAPKVSEALRKAMPQVNVVIPHREPCEGAALLALKKNTTD